MANLSNINNKFIVESDGDVGIGVTTALDKLNVGDGNIRISQLGNVASQLILNTYQSALGNTTYKWFVEQTTSANSYSFQIGNGTTPYLHINSLLFGAAAGNVGIGTTSPSAKLEVRGTAPTYTNSSTVFWGGTTNNDSHNGIMLSSYGDALGGSLASNLLYSNSGTPTQTNVGRSSGQIKFGNTTVATKTSDINFGGYYKGTTTFVERMRINGDGNVGIGTDDPDNILHIRKGDTTYGTQVGADTMLFLETTNVSNALQFTSANTGQQYIMFGDDDPNVGWISYNHSDNNLNFRVNGSERVRIKSNGQVNISQKPNSGLDYDLLINLGTSPDGLVGYQTREQFNNATLQKWYNVDAANSGSSQWVRLGTLSNFPQGGYTFCLTFYGHTGYNASNDQDFNCKLFMKTSNGGGTGPRFNSWVENTGKNQASPAFKWINKNASGTPTVGGTSYELYMNVPAYCNGSIYAINKHSGDWTSQNAIGQSDPGANSTTVLQAQNVFNILNTNVGIGTTSPSERLTVDGNAEILKGDDARVYIKDVGDSSTILLRSDGGNTSIGTDSNHDLQIHTNGSQKMRITSDGKVGINTSSFAPTISNQLKLGDMGSGVVGEVLDAGVVNGAARMIICAGGATGQVPILSLRHYSAAYGIDIWTYWASPWNTYIDNRHPSSGFIFRNNCNASGGENALMEIRGTGTIFMYGLGGYTSSNADVRYATSSKELYYQTSSKRYKTNILNLENSLDKINKLRPVRYVDINTEEPACGLIAEETVEIIPEVVFTKEIEGFDKPQVEGINYSDLVPFLIKSIQELKAEIELLKSK